MNLLRPVQYHGRLNFRKSLHGWLLDYYLVEDYLYEEHKVTLE